MARSTPSNLALPETPPGKVAGAGVSGHSILYNLFLSLRPGQWTKNLLVFAALIFAVRLFDVAAVAASVAAFVIFCALSGVVYLINDVADRESDLRHPI